MGEGREMQDIPTEELWAELERRGEAIHAGWCYPAQASDAEATALVTEHGYEFGPWQLIEKGEKLAEPPSWKLMARLPVDWRRDPTEASP